MSISHHPSEDSMARWNEVEALFDSIRNLDPAQRLDQLKHLKNADPILVAWVEALLEADALARVLGEEPGDDTEVDTRVIDEPPDDFALAPGDQVGPYFILGTIGHGGMGSVYLAVRETEPLQFVALKQIRYGATPDLIRRFHAERQLLAHFKHPHIVRLLDSGTGETGAPYLVMEFIDGPNLSAISVRGSLNHRQITTLVRDIALAIDHAHDHGIVHRDLKPSNILISKDGVPKVSDFGLARPIIRQGETIFTHPGAIVGTPSFSAPEQIGARNGRNLPTVDIYSLGAILYFLLAGRPPYLGGTHVELCMKVLNEEPRPPRAYCRHAPYDLETIALKAMARNPSERFLTAGAMAEQLQRYLDGLPLTIRRPSPITRLSRWASRYRGRLLASGALAVTILVASITLLIVENRRLVADAQARESMRLAWKLIGNAVLAPEYISKAVPLGSDAMHNYILATHDLFETALRDIPGADQDVELRYRTALINFTLAESFEWRDQDAHIDLILQHLSRSITLLESVLRDRPEEPWYRYNLFRSLSRRGVAHTSWGPTPDFAAAEADHLRALEVIQTLAGDHPDSPTEFQCRDAVAYQHVHLAILRERLNDVEQAKFHALEARTIARQLVSEAPDDPLFYGNLYRAEMRLAMIALYQGQPDMSVQSCVQALDAVSQLAALGTDLPQQQYERAATFGVLAFAYAAQNLRDEACSAMEENETIMARLVEAHPHSASFITACFGSRAEFVELRDRLGLREEADLAERQLIEDLDALLTDDSPTADVELQRLRSQFPRSASKPAP
ncbi:serine/threonine-protein kinase [Tautonia rosea]|uniref:serine/threonine-protein kinase n=1 Tax=Tautonia rosea TaxID=2728037 RepID=UPI0014734DCA|nr:serine/threonine-protein kinase [Tautonia rosea]